MTTPQFLRALEVLLDAGISWLSFVPKDAGPEPALCADRGADAGLLLFLSFGARFAGQTHYEGSRERDPFDTRSRQLATAFAAQAQLPDAQLVYPSEQRLDLRAWLSAGRVQYSSPLGTGIRPDCGPWLAVRAALVVSLDHGRRQLLLRRFPPLPAGGSPCESCASRACVSACPAGAVSEAGAFGLMACVEERLSRDSSCALRCHARLACPVGEAFRYSAPQLRYHYAVSLRSLQDWRGA